MNEATEGEGLAVGADRPKSESAVWITVKHAAELVDVTEEALRRKLMRSEAARTLPRGVVTRWGRSLRVHRERFLRWLDTPTT